MKILSLAAVLPAVLSVGSASASIHKHGEIIHLPTAFKTARYSPSLVRGPKITGSQKAVLIRGGSDDADEDSPELIDVASDALLYVFTAFASLSGVSFALLPNFSTKFFGEDVEPGSIEEYCQEATGCFALELAVTGYLAASGRVGVDQAIAYGTLPDLYFMVKNIASGRFEEFGTKVRNFMAAATVVAGIGTYSLFTEKWHPATVAKVMTILPALKGIYSYVDPVGSGKKMLGTDISENDKAHTLYCTSGQCKVISAFYRGSLAFGVDPLKGLGYTMLLHSGMTLERLYIRKNKDTENAHKGHIVHLALSLLMGVVWVLNS